MTRTRLETFSDGVLAIIITIMVLELHPPHSTEWVDLEPFLITLLCYVLSFAIVVIYWGNHHHLFHAITRVTSGIIWSNTHLLFWLSLIPFATRWMGETGFERAPVIAYAALLTMCAIAYTILQQVIMRNHRFNEKMALAMKIQGKKGMLSLTTYAASVGFAFLDTRISAVLFLLVAVIWIIPDKNIERALGD